MPWSSPTFASVHFARVARDATPASASARRAGAARPSKSVGAAGVFANYISFITGPSRTADIERVLTIGVHGPERLIIVVVDEFQQVTA